MAKYKITTSVLCLGHDCEYIVEAESAEEARKIFEEADGTIEPISENMDIEGEEIESIEEAQQ